MISQIMSDIFKTNIGHIDINRREIIFYEHKLTSFSDYIVLKVTLIFEYPVLSFMKISKTEGSLLVSEDSVDIAI